MDTQRAALKGQKKAAPLVGKTAAMLDDWKVDMTAVHLAEKLVRPMVDWMAGKMVAELAETKGNQLVAWRVVPTAVVRDYKLVG